MFVVIVGLRWLPYRLTCLQKTWQSRRLLLASQWLCGWNARAFFCSPYVLRSLTLLNVKVCNTSDVMWICDQTLHQIGPTPNNPRQSYWWLSTFSPALRHAVTLTFDPLTLNVFLYIGSHVIKPRTKLERNQTICGWVIDHFVNYRSFFIPAVKIRGGVDENVRVVVSSA